MMHKDVYHIYYFLYVYIHIGNSCQRVAVDEIILSSHIVRKALFCNNAVKLDTLKILGSLLKVHSSSRKDQVFGFGTDCKSSSFSYQ